MARPELSVTSTAPGAIHDVLATVPRGGAIVRLPSGRHRLDRPLELPASTTLVGRGRGTTVLEPATPGPAIVAADRRHVSVRDLTISGGTIALDGVGHATVAAVELLDAPGDAIALTACDDATLQDVAIRRPAATGVLAISCRRLAASDVAVTGAGAARTGSGVHLDATTDSALAVAVDGASAAGVIVDATSGPSRAIALAVEVTGAERGVVVRSGLDHPAERVTVTGRIAANRVAGIVLTNAADVTVLDATVEDNGHHGVLLEGRTGARRTTLLRVRATGHEVDVAIEGGSRDTLVVPSAAATATATTAARRATATATGPAALATSPLARGRRLAARSVRRADRAARRAGRRAPAPVRRTLATARRRARSTWRQRGGRA
jgi:hypothetical protein